MNQRGATTKEAKPRPGTKPAVLGGRPPPEDMPAPEAFDGAEMFQRSMGAFASAIAATEDAQSLRKAEALGRLRASAAAALAAGVRPGHLAEARGASSETRAKAKPSRKRSPGKRPKPKPSRQPSPEGRPKPSQEFKAPRWF